VPSEMMHRGGSQSRRGKRLRERAPNPVSRSAPRNIGADSVDDPDHLITGHPGVLNAGHETATVRGIGSPARWKVGSAGRATLQAIKMELRKRLHEPIAKTAAWVYSVLKGT